MPLIGSIGDVKRHWKTLLTILIIAACSPANFEKSPPSATSNPPGPTGETPCSPIGGSFPSNQNGMYGWIVVQTQSTCNSSGLQSCNSHEEMTSGNQGDKLSDMVVSAPLVPTRDFSVGFATRDGGQLNYRGTSTPVREFWGLNMRTKIALASGDAPGLYQFLAIVDDGFRMTLETSNDVFLNLEDVNSSSVVSTKGAGYNPNTVYLNPGDRVPFRIQYYQTPATEIAFFMMWRRVNSQADAQTARFERCSGVCGRNAFWNVDGGGAATANYNALYADGWRPMRAENFWMPDNLVHTCQ
jgi:hypothetical protein